MNDWNYGDAYKRFPIEKGIAVFSDGSKLKVHDIFNHLPSYMLDADLVFVDPPWNQTNISTFYTKANKELEFDFTSFYKRLFVCIRQIDPKICYIEIGKEYLSIFIEELKKIYKYVTFYNSTYYHNKENKCYVIRGANKFKKPSLDGLDEEDIIKWICKNEEYNCIADLCMGRGLVAVNAYQSRKKFVGTELNHKRLSVALESLNNLGAKYEVVNQPENSIKKLREKNGFTQMQLAEMIGINLRQYQRYEKKGKFDTINFRSGILLAKVLKINPMDLLD